MVESYKVAIFNSSKGRYLVVIYYSKCLRSRLHLSIVGV